MELWDNIQALRSLSHGLMWGAITVPILATVLAAGATGLRWYIDRRIGELSTAAQAAREAKLREDIDNARHNLYRIRSIEIRFVLFWHQSEYPNALKFDWYTLRDVAIKSTGLKIIILSETELQEFLENKRPHSSYLQFTSQKPLMPVISQSGSALYQVLSKNELLDTQTDYLIGSNIDKLNNFKAIIISSPFYESDDPFAREYTGSRLDIHNFWTSIKRVQFQLFMNWVAVASEDVIGVPQFTTRSSWGTVGTGYWYESKPLLLGELFQDVRSRYEEAILRQSGDEKARDENTRNN